MITSMYLQLGMITLTVAVYLAMVTTNQWFLSGFELVPGVNWIYLPAGAKLVFTLLFGAAGAVGVFIAALIATRIYYFPNDFISSVADATVCAIGPYIIYRFAAYRFNFSNGCLQNLTPSRLLVCCVAFALANSLLQHTWLIPLGHTTNPPGTLFAMFTGDLLGALAVLYLVKLLLGCVGTPR